MRTYKKDVNWYRDEYEGKIDPHIEQYNHGRMRWRDLTNAIALVIKEVAEEKTEKAIQMIKDRLINFAEASHWNVMSDDRGLMLIQINKLVKDLERSLLEIDGDGEDEE